MKFIYYGEVLQEHLSPQLQLMRLPLRRVWNFDLRLSLDDTVALLEDTVVLLETNLEGVDQEKMDTMVNQSDERAREDDTRSTKISSPLSSLSLLSVLSN